MNSDTESGNKKKPVYAYVHTHWDREWYMEYECFRIRLLEIVDNVVNALNNNKLDWFYFDGQIAALSDYLEIRKEKKEEVIKLIKEKKLYIGPYYVSSDSFLTCCEFYLRNLEYGIKTAKEEYGCNDFICYIADSFGHSRFLPYIIKYFNIKYAMLWRGLEANTGTFFDWNGVITHNLKRGYFQNQLMLNKSSEEKALLIETEIEKINENNKNMPLIFPLGGDHLNIPKNVKNEISAINKKLKQYKICFDKNLFDIFGSIDKKSLKKYKDNEFRDNNSTFLLDGVYSCRNDLKQENAKTCRILSQIAEPFIAFLNMINVIDNTYENEFKYAYIETIKNHAHDSLYGCNIDGVNSQIKARYKKAQTVAQSIINREKVRLESENGKLTVFNLGKYSFSGLVKLKTDKKIKNMYILKKEKGFAINKLYNPDDLPMTEDFKTIYNYLIPVKNIKPFSISILNNSNVTYDNELKINKNSIENEYIKIEVNSNNEIDIQDKIKNKIYKNVFIIKDLADIGDSYNFGALNGDKFLYAKLKKYEICINKGVNCILKTVYNIKIPKNTNKNKRTKECISTDINVDYILEALSGILKIEIKFINKCTNHKIGYGIKLKSNTNGKILLYCEDMLGITCREIDAKNNIYNEIPAKKGVELKTNTIPFNRFIYSSGIGVITEGIHSATVEKECLFIDILRSTGQISNPQNPCRGTSAGPPLKALDSFMKCEIKAKIGICFEDNVNRMYKHANDYFSPVVSCFSNLDSIELLSISNDDIQLLNINTKQKGIIYIRLFNSSNKNIDAQIKCFNEKYTIYEQKYDEEMKPIKNSVINFKAHEIKMIVMI